MPKRRSTKLPGGFIRNREARRGRPPYLFEYVVETIALVSAFGPTVLANYAEATTLSDGKPRDKSVSLVIGYLAERIEPAETVFESALYADYNAWCRAFGRAAVSAAELCVGVRSVACRKRARKNPQTERSLLRYPACRLAMRRTRQAHVAASCLVVFCRDLSPPVAACRDTPRPVWTGQS